VALLSIFERKNTYIENFAQLSTLPDISFGGEYFEPRYRFYADNHEELFTDMKPISTMDFIYAE
jgi:hypothetical protein